MRGETGSRGDLHDDVGGLDDADDFLAGLQVELVDGLARQQADQAMRPGLDLDDRGDGVLAHRGDDAGEPVAGTLADDRPLGLDRRRSAMSRATSSRRTVR